MKIPITKDYGETTFVTGIRAFAALAVVMIHAGGAGLRGPGDIGNHLADLGRTGVYAFYVISGFSVAASFAASDGFRTYAEKRFFRIAPLYYFWITIGFLMGLKYSGYWRTLFHTPFDI
jgi:peptidoglycan/LPS O-acetylase OafA/YrhL